MNIYQKLIEIRKEVPYLQKENKGFQYTYVSSSQVLSKLKSKMDELGVLLIPNVISASKESTTSKSKDRDGNTKTKREIFTEINLEYSWISADEPEDKIVCTWYCQGTDDFEKGVGKALTYAEKYFFLKFFNIPTDKDDPDTFQNKNMSAEDKKVAEAEKKKADAAKRMAAEKAKAEAERKKRNDSYKKFLNTMAEQKKKLGDDTYYAILGCNGFEHANNINANDRNMQKKIYTEMMQNEANDA